MPTYAQNTSVSVEKSKAEIEQTLQKYGAVEFVSGWNQEKAYIGFKMNGRFIKMIIPLPDKNSREFTHTPGKDKRRTSEQAIKEWEQACRERWRALNLMIKAKLVYIETGARSFDEEFMADIVLPDGQTTGEFMMPQIQIAYETGKVPGLLPFLEQKK